MISVAIIIGSTRPGRKAPSVARWVHDIAARRTDATFEIVDIADYDLPHLDEATPPMMAEYSGSHTIRWAAKIASFDAFVFVTPEYNHSTSGALKNAIDFLFAEWNDKASGFVGYGVNGGTRAVEHLRVIGGELKLADVRTQVALSMSSDFQDGEARPDGRHEKTLSTMLDELVSWGEALKQVRPDRRLPDIARPDVEAVVVNQWTVGSPERQQAIVDAIADQWAHRSRPEALISFTTFTSTDGDGVLTYAQWTSDHAKQEAMNAWRASGVHALEDEVPGIQPSAPVSYELYRSFAPDGAPPRTPGSAIIVVSIKAAGADRAREWIDEVLAALGNDGEPHPGLISAHFHISADGTQILNYAEWVDEQAHRDALETGTTQGIGQADSPQWRNVQNMSGITSAGLRRYNVSIALGGAVR
jgi:NAD(P)H-dependent FMN reductase